MKALVINGIYSPKLSVDLQQNPAASEVWRYPQLSFENIPQPTLSEDDVIVEVMVCGICGSDVHCIETDESGYTLFSGPAHFPVILGHEFTGRVVEVGAKVKDIHCGQIVAAESVQACWYCAACQNGHLNQCENIQLVGLTINGALTSHVRVKAAHCYSIDPILEHFGIEQGSNIGTLLEPLGCAYNALFINGPGLCISDRVAVFGAGPIGLSFISLARAAGVSRIVAFDLINERVQLAKVLGADEAFNINQLAADGLLPNQVLDKISDRKGMTIVIEAAGAAEIFSPAISALAMRGTLIYVGRTASKVSFDPNLLVSKALRIVGSRGHAGYNIYPTLIKMIAEGKLDLTPIITSSYLFEDAMEAMQQARQRYDGKILIQISS